jgi:hypothetical protein
MTDLNNKIITDILDRNILYLLKIIHSHYPDKFTKQNIKLEYNFIKKSINYSSNNTIIATNASNTPNATKYIITKKNAKISNAKTSNVKTSNISKLSNVDRCCARIWNNIYERNTLKEVSDIDDKYRVKDFADIKIKSFNNQYIIGSQCKRKKSYGEKYCFQHKTHLPHGDYFDIPTKEICFHYLKECNYI